MSNVKQDSVIALLDAPEHIQLVLDTSIWASQRLNVAIGLLHSNPSSHRKTAVNYSGCLNMDEEENMLHEFATEEHIQNQQHKNRGKELLHKAQDYCQERFCKQDVYPIHRQCSISESMDYVDDNASLIVMPPKLDCKTTLAKLIRVSECPILVAHGEFKTPESALFAFDDKEVSHQILEWLCQSPLVRNMNIHIVMVAKESAQNCDKLREAYAKLSQAGIKCKKKIIDSDSVSSALLRYQLENQLGLLITGAFGQSRLREWMQGSDTEELLDAHNTPYLLFPKEVS